VTLTEAGAMDLLRGLYLLHPDRPLVAALALMPAAHGWTLRFELPQAPAPLCLAQLSPLAVPPLPADAAWTLALRLLRAAAAGPRYRDLPRHVLCRICTNQQREGATMLRPAPEDVFFSLVACDLADAPDAHFGRRLLLTLQHDGWRIGYQVPDYDAPHHKGTREPARWQITEWYPDAANPPKAGVWPSLEMAADVAIEAHRAIQCVDGVRIEARRLAVVLDHTAGSVRI
jgi:hypothetical protein